MSPIEFRAWDIKHAIMRDMEYLLSPVDWEMLSILDHILQNSPNGFGDYEGISNYILMQYTNKKDDNDVKIFQDDIVETPTGKSLIYWDETELQWSLKRVNDDDHKYFFQAYPLAHEKTIKVVGHKHAEDVPR